MTKANIEQPCAERLPYEKPALRSISLVADQVLGVGCKATSGIVANVNNPVGCTTTPCVQSGS